MQLKPTFKNTDQLEFDFRSLYEKEREAITAKMAEDVAREIDKDILERLLKAVGYNGSVDNLVKRWSD